MWTAAGSLTGTSEGSVANGTDGSGIDVAEIFTERAVSHRVECPALFGRHETSQRLFESNSDTPVTLLVVDDDG